MANLLRCPYNLAQAPHEKGHLCRRRESDSPGAPEGRLTIERLAELADISPSFLAYIETRGRKASLETIEKLAGALKVHVADLFKDVPGPKRDTTYDAAQQFIHLVRDRSEKETAAILDVVKAAVGAVKQRKGS